MSTIASASPLASSALSYATNQMNMAENNTPQTKPTKMKNSTSPLEENKETKETLSSQGQPDVSDSVRSRMNYQPTVNVGLIGHVAHGKSTLTKALSTVTTGRHAKEAERSMTIKLGYANSKIFKCDSPQCPEPFCYRATGSEQMQPPMCLRPGCGSPMHLIQHVSFVDAPGHHDLMSTMLTGAAVMDGALLVVASNESCPSPQTSEHLAAAQMMGLRLGHNIACVQTKLDVGSLPEILANKRDIEHFLTKAAELNEEKLTHPVPIVPIAAHMGLNIDAVIQALLRLIPSAPQRDPAAPARMLVVRSFDVNKPGASVSSLKGGVVGGSLVQGTLALGQVVEIRPGLVSRDGRATPISSRVVSLQSESHHLKSVVPGGLIAVGLEIDPILAKADNLVGHVVGVPGTLPPVFRKFRASVESLRTVSHLKGSKHSAKQHEKPSFSKNQVFQCSIGSMRAQGVCTKVTSSSRGAMTVEMELRLPVCAEADARVAFFSKGDENNPSSWRLAASGSLLSISEMELTPVSVDSFAQSVSFNAEESAPAVKPGAKPVVPVETKTNTSESPKSASEATATPAAGAAAATSVPSAAAAELMEKKELRPIPRTALQKEEDLKVRWYPHELPEVGELVMVMVDRIDTKFGGAYVKLLEFGNLEALASQNELSQQRVRSLKQVAHVSRREVMVVLRVDKEKGMIDVSKKRVSPRDRLLHESWFNQSRVMHSIFSRTASVIGCPMLTLYESVGWRLYELAQEATAKAAADAAETKVDDDAESTSSKKEKKKSGDKRKKEKDAPDAFPSAANKKSSAVVIHPLDLLQQMVDPSAGAAAQELRESLQADGEVEERLLEVLFQNVYHRLVMKSVKVKATLELSCLTPQGITAIQQVLAQVLREFNNKTQITRKDAVEEEEEEEEEEESSVEAPEIFLIASPHFQISSASRDKQKAIRLIERACARVVELMKQTGGHAAIITPAEAFVQ